MARLIPAGLLMLAVATRPAAAAELLPVQEIQLVQSALRVLGHLDEPVDGIDGRKTREALAAAAIDLGWPRIPQEIDRDVADDLNRAAAQAVAQLLGITVDGRWIVSSGDPISDLIACSDPVSPAAVIDGLVEVFSATGDVSILLLEDGRLVPLPPEGRPAQSEAHGFRVAGPDSLETLTEGDVALWRRCPAD
jgi:hypothetical protein